MTHTDYTRNILNIKDENIFFKENCLKSIIIKGIETKVFHGYLTYTPDYCPNCGCINKKSSIIKWSFKKGCKIIMNKVSNYHTLLILDKQRFYCKNCNRTFIASTPLVDYHKQISNNVKTSVTLDLMEKGSEKDISRRNGISTSSSNRILADISKDAIIKNNGHLPSVIGIDEFKALIQKVKWLLLLLIKIIKIFLIFLTLECQMILKNTLEDIPDMKE